MELITDYYKEQNRLLHESHGKYGRQGHKHIPVIQRLMEEFKCKTVLDYGCGKATLARDADFDVQCYDPGIPEYEKLPEPADLVVCTDVLEHIEPDLLENVLKHISDVTIICSWILIRTVPDFSKTLPDGTGPHKIVEPPEFWHEKIYPYFREIYSRIGGGKYGGFVILRCMK